MPVKKADRRVFVVIDVLRATTTIIEALSNGFTEVIPVVTVDEAFARDPLEMSRTGIDTIGIGGGFGLLCTNQCLFICSRFQKKVHHSGLNRLRAFSKMTCISTDAMPHSIEGNK